MISAEETKFKCVYALPFLFAYERLQDGAKRDRRHSFRALGHADQNHIDGHRP